MLQCPYCEEDAETCGHWDSFGDCRFYLGKVAPMISDLKARVAELEAALLRARTLPEITPEILQALAEMDCWATGPAPQPDINLRLINRDYSYGPLGWTNSARAFVELLNEGRKV